jgi:hypothetical protein
MTEVHTRDEAIAAVDRAIQAWSTNLTTALASAQRVARAAQDDVAAVVRRRAIEVSAIEVMLAAAENEQRRHLEGRLVRAREAHEQARRAYVRVSDVAAGVSQLDRGHTTAGTSQVAAARAQLAAMSRALDGYRSGGAVLGGGGSSGMSSANAGAGSLPGMGLAELDVSSADLDANPVLDDDRAGGTFGKGGLTRADYRWAVQTWNDTVGPGVAGGKTREDFVERDGRSNAGPLRRTADVYDMFLGTDRIRADRQPDGSLTIVNGRHRLLIARELGIKSLPGQVS